METRKFSQRWQESKSQDYYLVNFFKTKPATILHRPLTVQLGRQCPSVLLELTGWTAMIRQWLDNHSAMEQPSLPKAGLQLADLAVYLSILFVVILIVGKLKSVRHSHETLKAG